MNEVDLTPLLSEALYEVQKHYKIEVNLEGELLSFGFFEPEAMLYFSETMLRLISGLRDSN